MNMKTIGSAVVIILAAIVGLFLGAAMNDGLSGSILLAVIAGFVCVIYTIENSGKKYSAFFHGSTATIFAMRTATRCMSSKGSSPGDTA